MHDEAGHAGNWLPARRLPHVSEIAGLFERPKRGQGGRALCRSHSIADLRDRARARVPRMVFDFIDGGAGEELTLRRNARAFADVTFAPRVLRDVSVVETGRDMLGFAAELPLWLAPAGMTRAVHAHGEIGAARAAARAGVPYVLSTMASTSPEVLAAHAPDARRWFQLYLWRDRGFSREIVERARDAGFSALVLTVDVPVAGERLRDVRNGMTLPPALTRRTALNIARYPRWWFDMLTREPLGSAAVSRPGEALVDRVGRIFDPTATLRDLDWLREVWSGPIVVKGVGSVAGAVEVAERGVDALVVSNHGGRQLEHAPATLELVPAVRAAVGAGLPVFVDGGVRSGEHIAAAIAAGADAVGIGRAYLYGLAAGGERGVDRSLEILGSGLRRTMALLGAPRLDDLDATLLDPVPGCERSGSGPR
ncbi:alpha-hydroxy-acid oxidizing enzyme [Pseudoclavibacter endophyticus]|uniref:Alpha-hydroxy-acid oxidizing protein n=1 Tax=Pseudoclavibacter endophyticus TaxID=1778590 RepID=A0A6H9WPN6_9MICO|nr:alpha-hydroxy acid oxidase [Pseudoclavibacter endophyticus]KAB1648071.1 alpha-hydroxy-acid oxidizing protein [Pseudoclavibacter endophyticus]GGA69458.1 alpha-hydroxy-acid oxidizing enzyme [Pseudoclavibacter endophyticus]